MNSLIIICYVIMAYGFTNLLVNGRGPYDLLSNLRDNAKVFLPGLGEMFDCMMCTSTNVGLVMSVISMNVATPFTPFTVLFPEAGWLLVLLLDMFATSGAVWLIDAVELFFERLGEKAVNDMDSPAGETYPGKMVDREWYVTFTKDTNSLKGVSDCIISTTDGSRYRYYVPVSKVENMQVGEDYSLKFTLKDSEGTCLNIAGAHDIEIVEDE